MIVSGEEAQSTQSSRSAVPVDDPLQLVNDEREAALYHQDEHLRRARVLHARIPENIGGGGHPDKMMLILEGGATVLAKLGTNDALLADAKREVAAVIVARTLRWADLVPATVLREIPDPSTGERVPAAISVWWQDSEWLYEGPLDHAQTLRAAAFDALVAHQDRNKNNWLVAPSTEDRRLVLIDHGRAFGRDGSWNINSHWFQQHTGQTMPDEIRNALRSFSQRASHESLSKYLEPEVIDRLVNRATSLSHQGSLVDPNAP